MYVYIHIYACILTSSRMLFYVLTIPGLEDKRMVLQICVNMLKQPLIVKPVCPTPPLDCKRTHVIRTPACGCMTRICWDVVVCECIHVRLMADTPVRLGDAGFVMGWLFDRKLVYMTETTIDKRTKHINQTWDPKYRATTHKPRYHCRAPWAGRDFRVQGCQTHWVRAFCARERLALHWWWPTASGERILDRPGSSPPSKLKKSRNRCGAAVPLPNIFHFCTCLCHNQIGIQRWLCHTICRKIPPLAPRHTRLRVTTPLIRDGWRRPPDIQCRMSRSKRSHCSSLNMLRTCWRLVLWRYPLCRVARRCPRCIMMPPHRWSGCHTQGFVGPSPCSLPPSMLCRSIEFARRHLDSWQDYCLLDPHPTLQEPHCTRYCQLEPTTSSGKFCMHCRIQVNGGRMPDNIEPATRDRIGGSVEFVLLRQSDLQSVLPHRREQVYVSWHLLSALWPDCRASA